MTVLMTKEYCLSTKNIYWIIFGCFATAVSRLSQAQLLSAAAYSTMTIAWMDTILNDQS